MADMRNWSGRSGELLQFSMRWMDKHWSDETGLLSQNLAAGSHVRSTVWYATGLLMRNQPGDIKLAEKALRALLSYQWQDSQKMNYGAWARHPEEFRTQPENPQEAKDFDPNWREFIAATLILILGEFSSQLTPELQQEIRLAINRAAEGSFRRRVWALYSNIALLSAFLMDWAGANDNVPAWRTRAAELSKEIYNHFQDCQAFPEYNSPTYYGVDLFALAFWRRFAPSEEMRQMGAAMDAALWNDIGLFYHAGMRNICGPWSRTYGGDMRSYWALAGAWIALHEKAEAPLPWKRSVIGHEHDITMTPAIILLDAAIPDMVKPSLVAFAGERSIEKLIQRKPHRVATAWLSEKLMIGAEADSPEGGVYTDHREPIVFHWLDGDNLNWGCVKTHMPAKATVTKTEAKAEFFPRADRPEVNKLSIELYGEGIALEQSANDVWKLPGLEISIQGNLGNHTLKATEGKLELSFPQMPLAGKNPWLSLGFCKK